MRARGGRLSQVSCELDRHAVHPAFECEREQCSDNDSSSTRQCDGRSIAERRERQEYRATDGEENRKVHEVDAERQLAEAQEWSGRKPALQTDRCEHSKINEEGAKLTLEVKQVVAPDDDRRDAR